MKRIVRKLVANVRQLLLFKTAFERLEVTISTSDGRGGNGYIERKGGRAILVIKLN